MKLIREIIVSALMALAVVAFASQVHAQTFQIAKMVVTTPCSGVPITGVSANALCIDSSSGILYYPGASGWTAIAATASQPFSQVAISGSSSGTAIIKAAATAGTPTLTLPTNTDTLVGIAATQTLTNKTLSSPIVNEQTIGTGISASSSGYNAFTIASPVCTTAGTAGAVCAEPTHTFSPTGFADTNYFMNCTCTSIGTNVPVVESESKASNAVVITIAALTAASASCATLDCVAIHQ